MDIKQIKGGLIVSCQALPHEPMHSSFIMGRFATAAVQGGAAGIRANTFEDITEIKKQVNVPVIGIVKKDYEDSEVYITPTMAEVDEVVKAGADIIALDATDRVRPNGLILEELVKQIREKYDVLLMADIATYEDAKRAEELGFDFIGTTLRGYTPDTKGTVLPDINFIKKLVNELDTPIIAEGGIHTPEQLKEALDAGAFCAVVGGAITRPLEITKRFTAKLNEEN